MPTCIHCLCRRDRHLTMMLCPDNSGRRYEGNAGYDFSSREQREQVVVVVPTKR